MPKHNLYKDDLDGIRVIVADELHHAAHLWANRDGNTVTLESYIEHMKVLDKIDSILKERPL